MKRMFGAVVVGLLMVTVAEAHFVFIVPDSSGTTAKVIFSDNLKPDERVNIEKIAATKLRVIAGTEKPKPLTWKLDKAFYSLDLAGEGTRVVGGTTEYGVLQKGETPPFVLRYHSKAILGPVTGVEKPMLGEETPLEITASVQDGKLQFQAFLKGKPLPKAELTVIVPGEEESEVVVGDDQGQSKGFTKVGTYAVRVKYEEKVAGEQGGKKYESIRHYATLVIDWK